MKKQLRVTLSFRENNKDVYDILQKQPVIVDYICNIVREKIKRDKEEVPENIKKYIDKCLNERIGALRSEDIRNIQKSEEESKDAFIDKDVATLILNEED